MTPTELQPEITYRTEERLGIMGFTDPKQTPPWATNQAEKEAKAWAREFWRDVFEMMKK